MQAEHASDLEQARRLLLTVAEQLKVPLTGIARQAELGQLTGDSSLVDTRTIHVHATAALALVDNYLLGMRLLQHERRADALEPVSLSSMLLDITHELDTYAKQYDVTLELHLGGKYEPVMAHPAGLRAAITSLGYALIESEPAHGEKRHLRLAAHRTPHGIVAGVYGNYEDLTEPAWRRALELCGRSTQPFTALSLGSGAGLFVAEAILRAMATRLRVGRYQHRQGLATTLQPSQQLQLV